LHKGSLGGEDDAQTSHSTEKSHDTTLDDEKYDVYYSEGCD